MNKNNPQNGDVKFFKIGDYIPQNAAPRAMQTSGENYLAVYNGRKFQLGYRNFWKPYLEYNIEATHSPIEISIDLVPNIVIAAVAKHFGIFLMKEPDRMKILLEKASIKQPKVEETDLLHGEFYTLRQVQLMLEGFDLEPAITAVSANDYYRCSCDHRPTKGLGSKLYTKVDYYYSSGWDRGEHYEHVQLIPWEHTIWKSRSVKLKEDAYKASLARVQVEKEEDALAKERKEFAQMCGRKARKYAIPFKIALAFKGEDEEIERFLYSLKVIIKTDEYYDAHELSCGRARNAAEMARIGIYTGSVDSNRIKKYVLACLESKKIISD